MIDKSGYSHIDILILDLEGEEYSALLGLDFEKTDVRNIMVESRNVGRISLYLETFGYSLLAKLTSYDYLFTRK